MLVCGSQLVPAHPPQTRCRRLWEMAPLTDLLNFCTKGGICFRFCCASLMALRAISSKTSMLSVSVIVPFACCCRSAESSPPRDQGSLGESKFCLTPVGTSALFICLLARALLGVGVGGTNCCCCGPGTIPYELMAWAPVPSTRPFASAAPPHRKNGSPVGLGNVGCCT